MGTLTLNDLMDSRDFGRFQKVCDNTVAKIKVMLRQNKKVLTGASANKLHIPVEIGADNNLHFDPVYNTSTDNALTKGARDTSSNDADKAQFWQLLTGRKAGKVPANIHQLIDNWVTRRNIQTPQEYLQQPNKQVAFTTKNGKKVSFLQKAKTITKESAKDRFIEAIVQSIKKNGTKQYRTGPQLTNQFNAQLDQLDTTMQMYGGQWAKKIADQEIKNIDNYFKNK